jgi:hypothetical protein
MSQSGPCEPEPPPLMEDGYGRWRHRVGPHTSPTHHFIATPFSFIPATEQSSQPLLFDPASLPSRPVSVIELRAQELGITPDQEVILSTLFPSGEAREVGKEYLESAEEIGLHGDDLFNYVVSAAQVVSIEGK